MYALTKFGLSWFVSSCCAYCVRGSCMTGLRIYKIRHQYTIGTFDTWWNYRPMTYFGWASEENPWHFATNKSFPQPFQQFPANKAYFRNYTYIGRHTHGIPISKLSCVWASSNIPLFVIFAIIGLYQTVHMNSTWINCNPKFIICFPANVNHLTMLDYQKP